MPGEAVEEADEADEVEAVEELRLALVFELLRVLVVEVVSSPSSQVNCTVTVSLAELSVSDGLITFKAV